MIHAASFQRSVWWLDRSSCKRSLRRDGTSNEEGRPKQKALLKRCPQGRHTVQSQGRVKANMLWRAFGRERKRIHFEYSVTLYIYV